MKQHREHTINTSWSQRRRWKVAILRRLFHERDKEIRIDLAVALLQLELLDAGMVAEVIQIRPDIPQREGATKLPIDGSFVKILLSLVTAEKDQPDRAVDSGAA
jgi:MoxR-like ATPase